jgi:hypothetical protein
MKKAFSYASVGIIGFFLGAAFKEFLVSIIANEYEKGEAWAKEKIDEYAHVGSIIENRTK